MIETGFLGLRCDGPEHEQEYDEGDELGFLEYGFTDGVQLRRTARNHGWVSVPSPGAPWHTKDYCPRHHPPAAPASENVIEVRG